MRKIGFCVGTRLADACLDLVREAIKAAEPVEADFNGVILRATPKSHVMDDAMRRLPDLDFADFSAVLGWFESIRDASDHSGVRGADSVILLTFKRHGFVPEMGCGDAYRPTRDGMALWLIGLALEGIRSGLGIHQGFDRLLGLWQAGKYSAEAARP